MVVNVEIACMWVVGRIVVGKMAVDKSFAGSEIVKGTLVEECRQDLDKKDDSVVGISLEE